MASITCRNYIATDAKFPTLAAHHCMLLHAGGKVFCLQLSLGQRAIAFELTVPITTRGLETGRFSVGGGLADHLSHADFAGLMRTRERNSFRSRPRRALLAGQASAFRPGVGLKYGVWNWFFWAQIRQIPPATYCVPDVFPAF
jgi:hypothetical protein